MCLGRIDLACSTCLQEIVGFELQYTQHIRQLLEAQANRDSQAGIIVFDASLIDNNTDLPTVTTSWALDNGIPITFATNAEVQAGVVTDKAISPAGLTSRTATASRTRGAACEVARAGRAIRIAAPTRPEIGDGGRQPGADIALRFEVERYGATERFHHGFAIFCVAACADPSRAETQKHLASG